MFWALQLARPGSLTDFLYLFKAFCVVFSTQITFREIKRSRGFPKLIDPKFEQASRVNAQRMYVVVELWLAVLLQSSLPAGFLFENHLWFVIVHLNLINQSNHLSPISLACSQTTSFKYNEPGVAGSFVQSTQNDNLPNMSAKCKDQKFAGQLRINIATKKAVVNMNEIQRRRKYLTRGLANLITPKIYQPMLAMTF